jgi:hypothetical protein
MFNCGHEFTVLKTVDQSHNTNAFPQKCPECVEMEEDKHKDQRQAAHLKQEATQKAEESLRLEKEKALQKVLEKEEQQAKKLKATQQQAKSLALYKSQASSIEKHLADADDDEELRAEFTTMLKNCKLLWANKVKKAEIEANESALGQSPITSVTSLKEKLERAELMMERAEILCDREDDKPLFGEAQKKRYRKQWHAWLDVLTMMERNVHIYEYEISPRLEEFEKESQEAWEDALKLMKEE